MNQCRLGDQGSSAGRRVPCLYCSDKKKKARPSHCCCARTFGRRFPWRLIHWSMSFHLIFFLRAVSLFFICALRYCLRKIVKPAPKKIARIALLSALPHTVSGALRPPLLLLCCRSKPNHHSPQDHACSCVECARCQTLHPRAFRKEALQRMPKICCTEGCPCRVVILQPSMSFSYGHTGD